MNTTQTLAARFVKCCNVRGMHINHSRALEDGDITFLDVTPGHYDFSVGGRNYVARVLEMVRISDEAVIHPVSFSRVS